MSDRSDHLIERAAALLRRSKLDVERQPDSSDTSRADSGGPSGSRRSGQASLTSLPAGRRGEAAPVRSVAAIRERSTQLRVSIDAMEHAGLMVARANRARTTEEYRVVIGRVLRALHDAAEVASSAVHDVPTNIVMITSARPGEGKSFTSLNLGGSIAQNSGESVLVVDIDAKNNCLSDQLGLSGRPGFLDLVINPSLPLDDLIAPSDLPNLSFLPLGTRSTLQEGGIEQGFEERRLTPPIQALAKRFPDTLILLDAPPCLSTSDPHTLSSIVGQAVVVVEAERTQRSEVEAAIEMIRACPNITMLLNKIRLNTTHTFGTYDYFGSYT